MNIYTTQDERQLSADYGKYLTQAIAGLEDKQRVLCKIVHLPLSESIGEWEEISEERAAEIRLAKSSSAKDVAELAKNVNALSQEVKQAGQQSASQNALTTMLINTYALTDEQALQVKDLYPRWEDLWGQNLPKGFRLLYGGDLYNVLQEHTAQSDWVPGADTASLYALTGTNVPEEGEHAGTKEDPIPYEQMMLIEKDKYYTQDGVLYVGLLDAPNGYPNDLKDLPTLAQAIDN